MASAWKHPKTGKWWYRKAVPPDLKAKHKELVAMGINAQLSEVRHTLNASSNADAERKWSKANEACLMRFEAMRKALASGPSSLTQKQIAALAGDTARQVLGSDTEVSDAVVELSQGGGKLRASWEHTVELFKLIEVHGLARYPSVEAAVAKLIQGELLKQGIIAITHQSSQQLKARIVKDLPNVAKMLAAMQDDGDYREPEWVKGRPKLQEAFSKSSGKVTFKQLIAGWQRDRKPKPASVKAYEHWCAAFVRWRGNDDAATITRKDMIAWKEAMQADTSLNGKGIKLKLEGVRSMIEWGISNEKLPYEHNPARGVTVAASKSKKKGWPDEQAALILTKAREQSGYLRWAPLLMAVTGARAGEIAQLRISDLAEDDQGRWSATIMAEAGTVKTEAGERTIPLHSAVVKEGLAKYLQRGQS